MINITASIKSTSVMYYQGGVRAIGANPDSGAMIYTDSFRGAKTISDTITDTDLTSTSFFVGDKGDEVADYSYNYKLGVRASIKSTSVMYYQGGVRAIGANPVSDAMIYTDSYRGQKAIIATMDDANLTSTSFFFGEKGDEVANYSYNYKLGVRASIKSTSVMYYTGNKRAKTADPVSDAMIYTDSFRGAKTISDTLDDSNLTSTSFFVGEKGDEVANYSYNYKLGIRASIKSTSVMYYAGSVRAALANPVGDAMIYTDSYRGLKDVSALNDTNLTSTSFFVGDKGDEVADYSYNYKLGVRASIKSTSVMYYQGGVRAIGANPVSDAMIYTDSYRGQKAIIATMDDANLTSTSFFFGEKGDEVANYSYNYKLGVRASIKSTSVMYYTGNKRAKTADPVGDAMIYTDSYRGLKDVSALNDTN